MYVGTDIGGTFTDLVGFDPQTGALVFGKTLTNERDLAQGVIDCLHDCDVALDRIDILKHGTTQVINTLLQRSGAKTALVTTAGFADILEIGRAGRPFPFDLSYARAAPLVPRRLRYEVRERMSGHGDVLTAPSLEDLASIVETLSHLDLEAVAIAFINSYRNAKNEEIVAAYLRERLPDLYVTASSDLSHEWFEYERTSTAAANAYVGPRATGYLDRFDTRLTEDGFDGKFFMMGSHGGTLSLSRSREQPIALIESGPIGGCIGAAAYAKELGLERIIAFDMGGTTAKCALVHQSGFDVIPTYYVGGYEYGFPIQTPVLDIVEVGTGGGSIASVDLHGRLRVGPRSAGSDPGPVCFGRGGREATVTDANLALGRIGGGAFLGGALHLDMPAAQATLLDQIGVPLGYERETSVDVVAGGVVALANAQMATAIKELTIERGKNARDFVLFVFGGGGPLHGLSLARELGISQVVVPPEPGNFSALGMLLADARVDESTTFFMPLDRDTVVSLHDRLSELETSARALLERDYSGLPVIIDRQTEMRFSGQRHSLQVGLIGTESAIDLGIKFRSAYLARYGAAGDGPIECVSLRVTGFALTDRPDLARLHRAAKAGAQPVVTGSRSVYHVHERQRIVTPVFVRKDLPIGFTLHGPAIIEEYGSTTVLGPSDTLRIGSLGEMSIDLL